MQEDNQVKRLYQNKIRKDAGAKMGSSLQFVFGT